MFVLLLLLLLLMLPRYIYIFIFMYPPSPHTNVVMYCIVNHHHQLWGLGAEGTRDGLLTATATENC